MRRVLVTGASGYIGRLVLGRLANDGTERHGSSRSTTSIDRVTWHAADLLKPGAARRLVEQTRPDAIIHCAWNVTPGQYWANPENAVWRDATAALAESFFTAGGSVFVGAGSCAEYDWSAGLCDERLTPLAPATPYGHAKRDAWRAVETAAAQAGGRAVWARIFHVFGGAEHPDRLVPSVLAALHAGTPALCTHGEQRRDFLHVSDVADAFAHLLRHDVSGAVNIGSGDPRRVRDVIDGLAARVRGSAGLVRLGARPTNEPATLIPAVERLRDEAGWVPRLSFDQALDRAVAEWRALTPGTNAGPPTTPPSPPGA
jgi:nucleoside-diphosphate-sugar epimerase